MTPRPVEESEFSWLEVCGGSFAGSQSGVIVTVPPALYMSRPCVPVFAENRVPDKDNVEPPMMSVHEKGR